MNILFTYFGSLKNIRIIWSIFFIGLFFLLIYLADFSRLKGYEIALFLLIDPLVWLSGLLTSFTVYNLLWLALLIIIPTLFLGRFFCSWICPLGILNQWFGALLIKRSLKENYQLNSYQKIYRVKYYILTILLIFALLGSNQIGLFDPIVTIFRASSLALYPVAGKIGFPIYNSIPIYLGVSLIGILFILIIFANRFVPRFYCRTLCPLGGLLGLLSYKAPYRIRRDIDLCIDCDHCLKSCQGASDPHSEHRVTECHLCMNCISDCPTNALEYRLPENRVLAQKPFDINRRRLLEVAMMSAIFVPTMKSAISAESESQHNVIRPPGSINEQDFLKRCIKCSACMRVCPTNALHPALLESGVEGLWTPIMINKIGYCEHHCVLCSQVCPTGAIKAITVSEKVGSKSKDPIKIGTAFFDKGRCLPWAMDVECIVCEEVCPTTPKAIWYRETTVTTRENKIKKLKRPYLDPTLCIGCGICENKCPVSDLPAVRVSSIGETRSKENLMILK